MEELKRLKKLLCKELEEYASRNQLDSNSLDTVDKLAHAMKNLDKVIMSKEMEESGSYRGSYEGSGYSRGNIRDGMGQYYYPQYTRINESGEGMSERSYRGSYDGGSERSYRGSYEDRSGRGAYDGRSMYSGHGSMVEELKDLMHEAPDDGTRSDIQRLIKKLEER